MVDRPQKPDVALQFVYSQLPYLQLVNQSDQLARDIYGKITLWSLDKLPENTSPIQIQGIGFNWLRAQDKSEPQYIWGGLANTGMLQPGNLRKAECSMSRLYGSKADGMRNFQMNKRHLYSHKVPIA